MTEQDKQALIKHFCKRDCGDAAENCEIMPCHEIELIQEFPTTEADSDTISRAKAIEAINKALDRQTLLNRFVRKVAIDAIKQLHPAQPAPSQVAKDISRIVENEQDMRVIAQPERIKGHWIEKPHVHGVAYCSLCDYELHTNDTNFCPNCGADMREVTE